MSQFFTEACRKIIKKGTQRNPRETELCGRRGLGSDGLQRLAVEVNVGQLALPQIPSAFLAGLIPHGRLRSGVLPFWQSTR